MVRAGASYGVMITSNPRAYDSPRVQRNAAARRRFQRKNPCPATGQATGACPGYMADHIVPLKRGGADAPGNMQWQTSAEAKARDRVELPATTRLPCHTRAMWAAMLGANLAR